MRALLVGALLAGYVALSSVLGLALPGHLAAEAAHAVDDPPEDAVEFFVETWIASPLASLLFVAGSALAGWAAWRRARERRRGAVAVAFGLTLGTYVLSATLAFDMIPPLAVVCAVFTLPGLVFATAAPVTAGVLARRRAPAS